MIRLTWLLALPFHSSAQTPPRLSPATQLQLMIQQPPPVITTPASATAAFDPPVTRPGETVFYRVSVAATESSVQFPDKLPAPLTLMTRRAAQGQILQFSTGRPAPLTTFLFEVTPTTAGRFVIPPFLLAVDGQPVPVPAAMLEAVTGAVTNATTPRRLVLEAAETNLFIGQPFNVRVILPATPDNRIEALRELQINGDGLITDKNSARQTVTTVKLGDEPRPAFIYETTVTPIAAGKLTCSAQAFTAGREFTGPISITGQVTLPGGPPVYDLMVSGPLEIHVRPLPAAPEAAGYSGAMGKFYLSPPSLSTNRLRVGEPVQLKFNYHALTPLSRFVPPAAPRSRDWLVMPGQPPGQEFTLVPLTDAARETPVIPFSYFDPDTGRYVELNVPALPVTVTGGSLPTEFQSMADEQNAAPPKLGGLARTPGETAATLTPLQLRGWQVALPLLPVLALLGLWRWDRHRRFLAAHPEIILRRRARRALRREKRKLQKAARASDAAAFASHAVNAMKIACAPHFPAHPQALVCGDVLAQLDETQRAGRAGDSVRQLFAAVDTQFAPSPGPAENLLARQADVDGVLRSLEEKL